LRKQKEEKIKKEEDKIIDNLNKKQEIFNQRYGMKRNKSAHHLTKSSNNKLLNKNENKYYIGNSKIVTNLNQRLYYNEMTKKDLGYKSFLEKANRLMDTCEFKDINNKNNKNDKKWNKSLDIKINCFRKETKKIKRKNLIKNSSAYIFIDSEEKNPIKEEEEKNNNNFDKIIKDEIDLKINETSIMNNSKSEINGSGSISNNNAKNDSAEKIIDIFFYN